MFEPIEWKDRVVDSDGTVVEKGTPLNANNLNRIEQGIAELATLPEEIVQANETASEAKKTAETAVESVGKAIERVGAIEAQKGQAGGYAELDANGIVPSHQLPTQVKESRVVADISARDALETFESLRVLVLDATTDSTVKSGWAEYVFDGAQYIKVSEGEQLDLTLKWSDIDGKPATFTPTVHKHVEADISDLDKYTKAQVDTFVGNINEAIATHTSNTSNPHNVTKTQVGLGSVQNYGIATQTVAESGASSTTYMTPQRTTQLLKKWIASNPATTTTDGAMTATDKTNLTQALADIVTLLEHASSTSNPHNVTKTDVGLSLLSNYALASQTLAEAGTAHTAYMTPLRTKNAIDKFVPKDVSGFNNDAGYVSSNAAKITVSATAPTNPSANDIWIVT